jgi:hypothetical protein
MAGTHGTEASAIVRRNTLLVRVLLAGVLGCSILSSIAFAQVFQPYPHAKITEAQWQAYLADVKSKLGATQQSFPNEHFIAFSDAATNTYFTFTQPGHPAHPAWITQRLVSGTERPRFEIGGFYAGDETAFAKMYAHFEKLSKDMIELAFKGKST